MRRRRCPRDPGEAVVPPEIAAQAKDYIPPGLSDAEKAERSRLQRQMRGGGRFFERRKAEGILDDMKRYQAELKAKTANEEMALREAEIEKATRQESIIWANKAHTMRHYGEEAGFGVGQMRIPEAIESPPQPEAFANVEPVRPGCSHRHSGRCKRWPGPPSHDPRHGRGAPHPDAPHRVGGAHLPGVERHPRHAVHQRAATAGRGGDREGGDGPRQPPPPHRAVQREDRCRLRGAGRPGTRTPRATRAKTYTTSTRT